MQKIISLFCRNYETDYLVRNEIVPGAEWVIAGEGIATAKIDGTCCLVRNGKLYKRYELKHNKTAPEGFEAAQSPDPKTGDTPGWVPVGDGPEDKWHREAFDLLIEGWAIDGTYELVGPKIQKNPYKLSSHRLIRHGKEALSPQPPRDFNGLRSWLENHEMEGIVWHHPDGRMVKLKRKDFGLPWPVKH